MNPEQPLPRLVAEKAGDICRLYRLDQELQPLLADEPAPLVFLDRLLFEDRHVPAAVDFLAYALPKREAVWWGCLCVQLAWDVAAMRSERHQALRAAVRWTVDPSEENRHAAGQAAQHLDPSWPSACLAQAAFESEGSIQPPDQPPIATHPLATAQGVRNAVHLLASKLPAEQQSNWYCRFVAMGIGVARRVAP